MKLNDQLILEKLLRSTHTANEVIEKIRRSDFKDGVYRSKIHFYTHLNKRFDPLRKSGFLTIVGRKKGPTGREEKIWAITKLAEAKLARGHLDGFDEIDEAA